MTRPTDWTRNAFLLITFALLSVGCGTGDFGATGSQGETRAQSLSQNGRHAEAAEVYIGLASAVYGPERDRLTLLAVQEWLDAGDGRRAQSALREVTKPSSGDMLWLWNSAVAAMYLFEGRPDDALIILEPMSKQALTLAHRSRVEALRADAWFQMDDAKRAVELYVQRENWLKSANEIRMNRERLWAGLTVSNANAMRSAAEITVDPVIKGWLDLGALAAATGQQGIGWANGVPRWQAANEAHPAMDILDEMALPVAGDVDFPRRIALLLPVTGKRANAGKAIQNGFFGAYFGAMSGLEDAQHITVYDISSGNIAAAYERAVLDGAEFVVGPLLRRNVQALASEAILSVPVLALNYLPDEYVPPPGFFQFALSPEDEAIAVASRAMADSQINAVALYPNNDWGRRIMNSFASQLEQLGGRLLDYQSYETGTQDFSLEIEALMGLSHSVARYNRLRANLGEPLQFDPRRRQDVNFVFLAADAKAGRLIKSQLKFHYAGELPVYSTSVIYSLDGRSNNDLNGIMFADAPWMISPPTWIADYPALYSEYWPAERRMGRLHAMGYDAYHLVGRLFTSGTPEQPNIVGASGQLYMDENGRVHRHLAWARFERGEPVAVPDVDTGIDPSEIDQPQDDVASVTPTQWQSQPDKQ